jgi:hypothetical protein
MISGALQVAIDYVNSNPDMLPGYKLEYIFNNTCGDEMRSLILIKIRIFGFFLF